MHVCVYLSLGVSQYATLPATALGDEATCPVDSRGMELHELLILKRNTCTR